MKTYKKDEEQYKEIFLKYYSPLCEYASQYLSDDDAEELVQDFMLFIWEYWDHISIDKSLKSYFFVSIKNRCLNALKKKYYHEKIEEQLYQKMMKEMEESNEEDLYTLEELNEKIQSAINRLPETYKATFILSRTNELTNKEIADHLNVSIKTVEYRISQALKILRLDLKEYFPFIWLILFM